MKNLSLYIHIPFCAAKCSYCDFLSFPADEAVMEKYVDCLREEIKSFAAEFTEHKVSTIYFGGGTPTCLSAYGIESILNEVRGHYCISDDAEITIEGNPESSTLEKLSILRTAGINRISFGVQSFDDKCLTAISRLHSAQQAADAFYIARNAGFGNVSIDLMFSLPHQSLGNYGETLDSAIALKPEHISCYGLTIEDGTPLRDAGYTTDEELDREMFYLTCEKLKDAGYIHYEISNFTLPGFESRHNTAYWNGTDYRGFGLGASSYVDNVRFSNTDNLDEYFLRKYERKEVYNLSESDEMSEFMFLSLRLLEKGVDAAHFFRRFDKNIYSIFGLQLNELIEGGLLRTSGGRYILTPRGIDLSNQVFMKFLLDKKA
ncbi:MAG: radical SAM family heme chaperone HemW [Defluviitaleaceae bacterium]|nr:radical SAM family heme chaperone HemW [Defluviitaleaceae bacterium]